MMAALQACRAVGGVEIPALTATLGARRIHLCWTIWLANARLVREARLARPCGASLSLGVRARAALVRCRRSRVRDVRNDGRCESRCLAEPAARSPEHWCCPI